MISSLQATEIILSTPPRIQYRMLPITQVLGRLLAEDIFADRDFPPFDRVCMDGIAISKESMLSRASVFLREHTHLAGDPHYGLQDIRKCVEVMTGSRLPENTCAVIPYENLVQNHTEQGLTFTYTATKPVQIGANIHPRGSDTKQGVRILTKHTPITGASVQLLASVGKANVQIIAPPTIAIVATGNELVAIHEIPAPYQIRKSNIYALQTLLTNKGYPVQTFHLADNEKTVQTFFKTAINTYDIIIVSGGVSAGRSDYIVSAGKAAGMQQLFHKVAQRPGKPLLFGKFPTGSVLFGLPGNPVSTIISTYRYILPYLNYYFATGTKDEWHAKATLTEAVHFENPLTLLLPVRLEKSDNTLYAHPIAINGSGDMVSFAQAQGLIELPAEKNHFYQGEIFDIRLF